METIEELKELVKSGGRLSEPMQFYSLQCAGATFAVNQGALVPIDGNWSRIGEKSAEFAPLGGTQIGFFQTMDPEIALFLFNRVQNQQDVITQETFLDVTTPANIKVEQAMQREITANNRLAEYVAEREKEALAAEAILLSAAGKELARERQIADLRAQLKAANSPRESDAPVVSTVVPPKDSPKNEVKK